MNFSGPRLCLRRVAFWDIMGQYSKANQCSYKHGWASGEYRHQRYMSHKIDWRLKINALSCMSTCLLCEDTHSWHNVCGFIEGLCASHAGISALSVHINGPPAEVSALFFSPRVLRFVFMQLHTWMPANELPAPAKGLLLDTEQLFIFEDAH